MTRVPLWSYGFAPPPKASLMDVFFLQSSQWQWICLLQLDCSCQIGELVLKLKSQTCCSLHIKCVIKDWLCIVHDKMHTFHYNVIIVDDLWAAKCVALFKYFFMISAQGTLERLYCVLLVFWGCNCDCKTILKNRLLWVWWLKQSNVLPSSFYNRAPLLVVCSEPATSLHIFM